MSAYWVELVLFDGAAEDDRARTEERTCILSSGFCSTRPAEAGRVSSVVNVEQKQVNWIASALLSERGSPRPPPSNNNPQPAT